MSATSDVERKLTVEDLDRFLESPAKAAATEAVSDAEAWDPTPYLDAAAVLVAFDPARLRAVRDGFDPGTPEDVLARLLPFIAHVNDGPQRGLWTLSFMERRAALRRLANRKAMRHALDANPRPLDTPVQFMFERVVNGKSLALSELDRDEVAALITVLDWVEGILDDLPERTAVRSALGKADLLAPMRRLAGRGFVGRERELAQLDDYVSAGSQPPAPLFVYGPGGVGKSTLLARFILNWVEPRNVPFVYIDLDRPTVRPDHPLTQILEAVTQLQVQFDLPLHVIDPFIKEITYGMGREEMSRSFESFGRKPRRSFLALKRLLAEMTIVLHRTLAPIVFVIDTFEEAQFLGPEIVWQMIDFLFELAPLMLAIGS